MKTKVLYQNKKNPWEHITLRKAKYEKPFFFSLKRTPNNQWMLSPRFFAMINLYFISFWRDNSWFRLGIGFGKYKWELAFHSIKLKRVKKQ